MNKPILTASLLEAAADSFNENYVQFMCLSVKDVIGEALGTESRVPGELEFREMLTLHGVGLEGDLRHKGKKYSDDYTVDVNTRRWNNNNLRFDFLNLLALSEFDDAA